MRDVPPRAPSMLVLVLGCVCGVTGGVQPDLQQLIHEANEARYQTALRQRYAALRGVHDPGAFHEGEGARFLYDFFYPAWRCPFMERMGRLGDGGKWIASPRRFKALGDRCTVVSYGAGGDISFEVALLNATDCTVYLADPTVDMEAHRRIWLSVAPPSKADRLRILPYGLGGRDARVSNADTGEPMNVRTLDSAVAENGIQHIHLLKVDVEGAEWEAFDHLFAQGNAPGPGPPLLDKVDEISIELHRADAAEGTGCRGRACDVKAVVRFFSSLEARGFRIFSYEANLFGATAFAEFSLIRRSIKGYLT